MSFGHASSSRLGARRRRAAALSGVAALALVVTGCTSSTSNVSADTELGESPAPAATAPTPEAVVSSSVADKAKNVAVDTVVELSVENGTFEDVQATVGQSKKRLAGTLSEDGTTWTASGRLEPGVRYTLESVAVDEDGVELTERRTFRTDALTLDEQTYPSIAPLQGETVGVGMPVIVTFDVPVTDRASIEQHLSVETTPKQEGSWAWLSNTEVHWRPKTYWKPGSEVTVEADINSVAAGNGIFGQMSRSTTFDVGPAQFQKIDIAKHRLRVFRNGKLLRTIPVTAGKDGFTTRSGIKVIIEKTRNKVMDASTIGINPGEAEYYRLDVPYAMRVTYSGEFVHGAPWSVGSQGSENVSHGCVGMNMTNAAWLFDLSRRGDVVIVTGSDRKMEPGNGYTDWNKSFEEYKKGSALS